MNDDIDNVDILPLLDTGYALKTIANGQNAVFRNGRLVYIILDIDKPGKYFFDLRSVFNASTGEGGKNLNIMFMNNAVPWQLNGKTISIDGAYPSGERFHVTGSENQANSSLIDFTFPLGLFQEAGIYQFQFEITDESGNRATSHYCFFQVTQNATLLAADFKNGVNPFDSDYTKWKNQVEQEINALTDKLNNLNTSADQLEELMNNYISKAQQYVEDATQKAVNKLLSGENTWTGRQHFNGGITFGNNAQGDTLIANTVDTGDLTATGNVKLPNTTLVNGEFELGNVLRLDKSVDGGTIVYLNGTKDANASVRNWLWGERYNKELDRTNNPHFYLYMAFALDCGDVGKPFAQFASGFFKGCNPGPITIPIGPGSAMFHVEEASDTLVLDSVSNISGRVTVGTKIWI